MPIGKKNKLYEVIKEGKENILRVDANSWPYVPSIENNPLVMSRIIELLVENPNVTRIVFNQRRNYIYNYDQTLMLNEVANLYNHLVKQKRLLSLGIISKGSIYERLYEGWRVTLQNIILNLIKADPIGAYVEIIRLMREEKINLEKTDMLEEVQARNNYLELLSTLKRLFENTKLINFAKPYIAGYSVMGDRNLYRIFLRPEITPDFMFTRLMAEQPLNAELLDVYKIDKNTEVNILKIPGDIKYLYHLSPPEFKLDEDKYEILDLARNAMIEHQPRREEFTDPEKMRQTFFNIGRDLILELAEHKGVELSFKESEELANILVRYTVGFGLIEVLLQDQKIQDVTINGPIGGSPMFIVHQDYDECVTNIIPSLEDGESWASKFRLISGRPLDEANPVLDTELLLKQARARAAIITRPLNPTGLAFAFRRHRDDPWTYPLFIKNKMMNPLAAGLLSFLVDGSRSLIFSGTRSSGKTSLLGSTLVEIMRKYRIISVEDTFELPIDALRKLGYNIQAMKVRSALTRASAEFGADEGIRTSLRLGDSSLIVGEIRSSIRGNEEVLVVENGLTKRIKIRDLENKDISNIYVPSMDLDFKFKLKKLTAFVKHPKRKKLLEITTRTGRKITVTPDHSIFTHKDFKIVPMECNLLKVKDKIIIPEKLPSGYNDIKIINLLEILGDENCRVEGYENDLRQIIKKIGWKRATQLSSASQDIYQYLRRGIQHTNILIKDYKKLVDESNYNPNLLLLQVKKGTSKTLPVEIEVSKDFCRFLGYYVAEGYTQKSGDVIFSNIDEPVINDMIQLSRNLFGIEPKIEITKGLGYSKQIRLNNKILGLLIKKLDCGRTSIEKRVPPIIFGLSEDKIYEFLKGYFDGDGSQTSIESTGNRIACTTISKNLANDLLYLFLNIGIVARVRVNESSGIGRNTQYEIDFKQRKYVELFLEKVGFKKYKKELIKRSTPHSNLNTVNYDINVLEKNVKLKRKFRHLRKYNSCGKEYLKKVIEESDLSTNLIKTFVNGNFFLDEVKNIKEIYLEEGESVYDLSVEPCQNFIGGFGGIMLHNTEAQALYEAMRIGALANVVAGTIHGADPYGVYDRVVNDLRVPKTSFKATDVIVISNPVRSADGLHKWRRITQIAEVRKHWEEDPIRENGFVDLMTYDSREDTLKPSQDLINGDSEVLKSIAGNVKEFAGNWDAIWENVLLRARIKEALVKFAQKLKQDYLLEAKFTVQSNDIFHEISDKVREETGYIDSKRVYFEWEHWLKRVIKEKQLK